MCAGSAADASALGRNVAVEDEAARRFPPDLLEKATITYDW
jgi:hypothetical protein